MTEENMEITSGPTNSNSIDQAQNHRATESQIDIRTSNEVVSTEKTEGDRIDTRKRRMIRKGAPKRDRNKEEGKMSVLGIRRVTKVGEGAKRLSFSACVVVGDTKGKVGLGLGKSRTVTGAIEQASARARKVQVQIQIKNGTIAYQSQGDFCKSKVLLRNAPQGTGIKAGQVVRAICTCAGIDNIVTKIIGNRNFLNVAQATIQALTKVEQHAQRARICRADSAHVN